MIIRRLIWWLEERAGWLRTYGYVTGGNR